MSEQTQDPMRRYREAKERSDQLETELRVMGTRMKKIGEVLSVAPVNMSPANFSMPMQYMNGFSVNSDEWPTYQQFLDLLGKYHTALRDTELAIGGLSAGDRSFLGV